MLKRIGPLLATLATILAGICLVLALSETPGPFSFLACALMVGVSGPAAFIEMRRRWKLEELAEAWWRKEISEEDLKRALAKHRIGAAQFTAMNGALRRRFGEEFSRAFETPFKPEVGADRAAPQPIG